MFGFVEMFGGVLIFGRIAAAHVPADHAEAKVNPYVAHFEALFAAVGMRTNTLLDLIEMRTFVHIWFLLLKYIQPV
jgi:hypothetical protein